jgi:hypothetical protein
MLFSRYTVNLPSIDKEFSIRYPKITFHHVLPGLVRTNALENQQFSPAIVTLGRIAARVLAVDPDTYSDVPVAKALTGGGGLQLTQQWGWKVSLEKWAEDAVKRKTLFDWALKRAQTAAAHTTSE